MKITPWIFCSLAAPFVLSGCLLGLDSTWRAEKNLIGIFEAQGFEMHGLSADQNGENSFFERASDGAKVSYVYVRPVNGTLAEYRLSAARNSPGFAALILIAGKISPDRATAIKEALHEFDATGKPVTRQKNNFTQEGDFKVRVDKDTLEMDNLWKEKGL
jgi:hypothetical protein